MGESIWIWTGREGLHVDGRHGEGPGCTCEVDPRAVAGATLGGLPDFIGGGTCGACAVQRPGMARHHGALRRGSACQGGVMPRSESEGHVTVCMGRQISELRWVLRGRSVGVFLSWLPPALPHSTLGCRYASPRDLVMFQACYGARL